jgi:hypothetical protein
MLWSVAYGLGFAGAIILARIEPPKVLLQSAKSRPWWQAGAWFAVAASFLGQIALAWAEYCGLK